MSTIFATVGEPVTTEDGKIICYVKKDLVRFTTIEAEAFGDFAEGETPWQPNQPVDSRCIRSAGMAGAQICINGEWRP